MMDDDSTQTTSAPAGGPAPAAAPTRKAATRKPAAKTPAAKASATKAPATKASARSDAAKKVAEVKAAAETSPVAPAAKKAAKAAVKRAPAKKAPARKAPARKAPARKAPAQRAAAASTRHFGETASSGVAQANTEQELAGHDVDPGYPSTDTSLERDPTEHPMDFEEGVAGFTRSVGTKAQANGSPKSSTKLPASSGPASAEEVEAAFKDNSLAQVLYHDWEAGTYDEKWSISFDERCITYARDRFVNLVGADVVQAEQWPYAKALEIGAGTGFFSLNLKQGGVLGEVYVTDVSSGMVEAAKRNAVQLGFEVQGEAAFAEDLPYPDDTFDVVVGHAVIHHIPDVEAALREILRVLKPGGRFVIAGEPTRIGDWYARQLGRVTWKLTTGVTGLPQLRERWARSQEELDASSRAAALEAVVDLHTFVPGELAAMANRAGAQDVETQTEEFLAALLGWPVRTFEAAVNPERLGWGWAMFAYKSWLRLSSVDRVLSRALPKGIFYNVGITGTKTVR